MDTKAHEEGFLHSCAFVFSFVFLRGFRLGGVTF
ncbi:MAG: hypothetical protein JWP03_4434 [Phycisphaerales bacterium]|nr:hypothetical protein [Phycisphaerales bacterium]